MHQRLGWNLVIEQGLHPLKSNNAILDCPRVLYVTPWHEMSGDAVHLGLVLDGLLVAA